MPKCKSCGREKHYDLMMWGVDDERICQECYYGSRVLTCPICGKDRAFCKGHDLDECSTLDYIRDHQNNRSMGYY